MLDWIRTKSFQPKLRKLREIIN